MTCADGSDMKIRMTLLLTVCLLLNAGISIGIEDVFEEVPVCANHSITDINGLGLKLLNKLIVHQGNKFISPVGLGFTLGILYSTSSNETAKEIANVILRDDADGTTEEVERELIQLQASFRQRNISIVNEILFENCLNINEEYVNTFQDNVLDEIAVKEDYEDFNKTANDTQSTEWKPHVVVKNFLSFNNSWKVQFLSERTERDYFYSGRRETTEVWMMSIEAETFRFYEDYEMRYKFIELPFETNHLSMFLALPTQYDQPANLRLDPEMFCKIKSKLIPTKLDMVSIPKFQFEAEISLKDELISMGIENAFNYSTAQFPGLSDDKDFHIFGVKQTINIEVDEDGSEAAAIIKHGFKPVAFRGVKEFIANHPFLFYVVDRKTGTILICGKLDEPSESISFADHLRF